MRVGDRLVRRSHDGAEFYFLSLMLAQLSHSTSGLSQFGLPLRERYGRQPGFFVKALQTNLEHFHLNVLREARRKRTDLNLVLV